MPDISMCANKKCKKRKQCHRYTATPDEYWQAYADFTEPCEHFWPNKDDSNKTTRH